MPGVGIPVQRTGSENDTAEQSNRADAVDRREDPDGLEELTHAGTPGSGGVGPPVVVAAPTRRATRVADAPTSPTAPWSASTTHHLIHSTKWTCTLRPTGDIRCRRR